MRVIFTIAILILANMLSQCSDPVEVDRRKQQPRPISQAEVVKVDSQQKDVEDGQPTPSPSNSAAPSASPSPRSARVRCLLPAGSNSKPADLEELIGLINSMALPLNLACLVDVLAHPLKISATISNVSAQPAPDEENPRFFFFSGQDSKLVLSVVPSGEGSKALEYSFLISNSESVKGEILFPVTAPLDLDQLGKRLLRKDGIPGSTCGACHANERLADASIFGANHYISRALQPKSSSLVSQKRLNELAQKCRFQASERCDLFDAIFGAGGIEIMSFPSQMPTMF